MRSGECLQSFRCNACLEDWWWTQWRRHENDALPRNKAVHQGIRVNGIMVITLKVVCGM